MASNNEYEHQMMMGKGEIGKIDDDVDDSGVVFMRVRVWMMERVLDLAFLLAPKTANGDKVRYLIGVYFDTFREGL